MVIKTGNLMTIKTDGDWPDRLFVNSYNKFHEKINVAQLISFGHPSSKSK